MFVYMCGSVCGHVRLALSRSLSLSLSLYLDADLEVSAYHTLKQLTRQLCFIQ